MSLKQGLSILFLLFLVALLGVKNYEVWNHPFEEARGNGVIKKQEMPPELAAAAKEGKRGTISTAPSAFIAGKNIFNPERKDFPVAPLEQNRATGRPQLILHGVTVSGDYQAASISNPGRPLRKGERETMTLKIGEKIGAYTLSKILPDRITLEGTNDTFEILLYDPKKPKKRIVVQAESKPAAITGSTSPPPQGPLEAPKPVHSKEVLEGTSQRITAPGPAPTAPGGEKASPPSPAVPIAPSSPVPAASSLPPPTMTPLPPPPPATKLDSLSPTKIPLQGTPGK